MAINQYEDKLKSVYDKHYCSGECIYYRQCKKGLVDDGLLFNCAKLGAHYGDGAYRKVLIVGKEPVTQNRAITQTAPLDKDSNDHYRRTLYTLATILKEEPKTDSYNDLEDYKELLGHFCLTNYFKCSFTETETKGKEKTAAKRSGVKASKAMCENCWEILMDEIKALKPEIVVIQGSSYAGAFWKEICKEKFFGENQLSGDGYKYDYEELTKHKYENGDPLYIVWAYHPTARGKYLWNKRLSNLRRILKKLRERLELER